MVSVEGADTCGGGGAEMTADEVARMGCPVLATYGEIDACVSPAVARRRAAQMDGAGVQHDTIVYPGAQHAFFNDTRAAYDAEAAADAWGKMLALFRAALS